MSTVDFELIRLVGARSNLVYEHLRHEWAAELRALELACFPTADPRELTNRQDVMDLSDSFPQGCFVGLDGDRVVAMGLGCRRRFDLGSPQHSLLDLFDTGDIGPHHFGGPWYYGIDIAVHPEYRRRGIGGELYELRKQVCRELNLKGIIAGGVIPGYAEHKHHMSAEDYVRAVREGDLYDPTLTFQLENGFEAPCALVDYYRDAAVNDCASLIVWHNLDYVPEDDEAENPA